MVRKSRAKSSAGLTSGKVMRRNFCQAVAPSTLAAVHALLHGRVVFQFRPDLPAAQIAALDQLVRRAPSRTLVFANRTGMQAPVAATAYLTLMTCPAVNARTRVALEAFRVRLANFGQAF